MFFMDGTQKKWNCQGKLHYVLHTHPLLILYLWDKKKLVTNNKKLLNSYICHSGYQQSYYRNIGYFGGIYTCENLTFHLQIEKKM
jgi:hypothetical protein